MCAINSNSDMSFLVKQLTENYLKDHKACGLKQYFEKVEPEYFDYIMTWTKMLDSKYPFGMRLYWTINHITEFPVCTMCGSPNKRSINYKGYIGNKQYCGHDCSVKGEHATETRKATCRERFGSDCPAGNADVMSKIKTSNVKHWGSECYFRSEIGKKVIGDIIEAKNGPGIRHNSQTQKWKDGMSQKWASRSKEEKQDIIRKGKATKKLRHGDENYTNRELAKETNNRLYGGHPMKLQKFKDKGIATNMERRGVPYATMDPSVIDKSRDTRYKKNDGKWNPPDMIEKTMATNRKRCGKDWYQQTEQWRDDTMANNRKKYNADWVLCKESTIRCDIDHAQRDQFGGKFYVQTQDYIDYMISYNREMYGTDWALQADVIKDKSKARLISTIGVDNVFKSEEFKETNRLKKLNHTYDRLLCNQSVEPLFTREEFLENPFRHDFRWRCRHCGEEFVSQRSGTLRCEDALYARCPKCNLPHRSRAEKEIFDLVYSYCKDVIGDSYSIIAPKQLDIYIPSKHLAIEFDGLYWHSNQQLVCDTKYHLNKTLECEKRDIQLIHVFEDEYSFKRDIVVSRIKNLLGIYDTTVYARKCTIGSVTFEDARNFLAMNHIQGSCPSSVRVGLYYNDELIALMTFGNYRKALGRSSVEGEYELLRFCSKLNYHVPGAASKLFTAFVRKFHPSKVISYADRRWSQGKVYQSMGFRFVHATDPNYWYVIGDHREHRFAWRKGVLSQKLESFDESKSEYQNMLDNDYDCIYDCGNLLYEWSSESLKK